MERDRSKLEGWEQDIVDVISKRPYEDNESVMKRFNKTKQTKRDADDVMNRIGIYCNGVEETVDGLLDNMQLPHQKRFDSKAIADTEVSNQLKSLERKTEAVILEARQFFDIMF